MKLNRLIFISLLFLTAVGHAGNLKGVGKYKSQEGEKLSFIKNQLHYQAFKDIITQELSNMNLDPNLFWEKYNLAFEQSFKPVEMNLKSKYGIEEPIENSNTFNDEKKKSEKLSEQYLKELRYKRLLLLSRFANIGQVFTSYQVQRMTRSSRFTSNYHIELLGQVNRRLLNQLYQKYTRESSIQHYDSLYVQTTFSLQGIAWPDIGVEDASLFSKAVDTYWSNWLTQKMGESVSQVEIVDEAKKSRISEYYRLTDRSNDVGSEFSNSLLLKIESVIEKSYYRPAFKKLSYLLKTRVNLVDLKMQKIIYYHDLPVQTFTITLGTNFETSSNVATTLSKFPIPILEKMATALSNYEREADTFFINVSGIRTIQDLISVKQKLEVKGITLGVQVELNKYNSLERTGNIIVHSRVSNQKLENFFNHFNETEVSKKLIANTEVAAGQYLLKLVDLAPVSNKTDTNIDNNQDNKDVL